MPIMIYDLPFVDGRSNAHSRSNLPVIRVQAFSMMSPDFKIDARALLDTGSEVSFVDRKLIRELEARSGIMLPVHQDVVVGWDVVRAPSICPFFDVSLLLGDSYVFGGRSGLAAPSDWRWPDVADIIVGYDILRQLRVTFDGPNSTISITDSMR